VLLIAVTLGRSEPVKNLNKNDIFLDEEINQSFSRIMWVGGKKNLTNIYTERDL
jgi:hypothetical protein